MSNTDTSKTPHTNRPPGRHLPAIRGLAVTITWLDQVLIIGGGAVLLVTSGIPQALAAITGGDAAQAYPWLAGIQAMGNAIGLDVMFAAVALHFFMLWQRGVRRGLEFYVTVLLLVAWAAVIYQTGVTANASEGGHMSIPQAMLFVGVQPAVWWAERAALYVVSLLICFAHVAAVTRDLSHVGEYSMPTGDGPSGPNGGGSRDDDDDTGIDPRYPLMPPNMAVVPTAWTPDDAPTIPSAYPSTYASGTAGGKKGRTDAQSAARKDDQIWSVVNMLEEAAQRGGAVSIGDVERALGIGTGTAQARMDAARERWERVKSERGTNVRVATGEDVAVKGGKRRRVAN